MYIQPIARLLCYRLKSKRHLIYISINSISAKYIRIIYGKRLAVVHEMLFRFKVLCTYLLLGLRLDRSGNRLY